MERTPSAPAVANGHASPSPSPSPRKRRRSERDDKNDADSPDALLAVQPGQKAPVDTSSAERAVHSLLLALGEDPSRPGLDSTPRRVALMFSELLSGYRVDATALLNGAIFNEAATDAVHIRGIRFSSLCEHHMLTFSGRVHVAYIPDGRVIGLSKVPRIVRMFAQRLQLQERLTRQIAHFLNAVLRPRGVAVIVEGRHLCASIRGVRSTDSTMLTSVMLGDFRTDAALREQLWSLFRTPSGADLF
ncbi:GTP cyclohydrolase 1 [Gracilariopsis chorda]|uniref:GTP cyclohydrolase 1 n=1 Tax=Gracilariopsis chorda TaxID=448386 RepID=A0A2V3IGF1_9FLOR|nr:GTP cyclohydrolase 1 [Gracilariopsis chorda]|eukprot:PXF41149.1 GTP cyclohydrolase 1 [Gracilariopsis chorda]